MKNYYKINEISKLYGIGTDSLRYYERLGILKPKRDTNGYRLYHLKDMYQLNIIRDLRSLDFSMAQIKEYLDGLSIDNTMTLLQQEERLIREQKRELEQRERRIHERIAMLTAAEDIPRGEVAVRHLPRRRCIQLNEHITRDEEMDFLIKKLHRRYEDQVRELGNLPIGAFASSEDVRDGLSNVYYSVFFVLQQDQEECDFVLPEGDYLSCYYSGGYGNNAEQMKRVMDYGAQNGLRLLGDPFEIYQIDNRYTDRPEEFLTEIQILVGKEEL